MVLIPATRRVVAEILPVGPALDPLPDPLVLGPDPAVEEYKRECRTDRPLVARRMLAP